MTRYRRVDAQKAAGFPVAAACKAAGVSRSAYYAWACRPSHPNLEQAELVSEIRAIHTDSRGAYGSPRVHAELRRRGQRGNHKRVERLMRTHGIVGHRPRRRRSLTRPDTTAAPAPDLLGRLFDPDRPDVAWCGDVTYIPTDQGWLYLASVIDLASRQLLGWSMGDHHDAALVTGALDAAVAARGRRRMHDTIFHADRGAEYASSACVATCVRLGLRRSMGRTGSCLDNAVTESWFASLKVELVDRHHYRTRAEARAAIFAWIHWYNRRRLHSTNGYLPPAEWEHRYALAPPATIDHRRIAPVSVSRGEVQGIGRRAGRRLAARWWPRYGVRYLNYWADPGSGKVFCLVAAPDADTAHAVHREAHGLVADEIYPVIQG